MERIGFRLTRMRLVLLYHVMRDLATLRQELKEVTPTPEQRRVWQRDYQALARELAETRQWARNQRIELRRLRGEPPDTAWLRRQLDTLEVKQ